MGNKIDRRDLLKSLATLPIVGALAYGSFKKKKSDIQKKNFIVEELGLSNNKSSKKNSSSGTGSNKLVRIGVVGLGVRGPYLLNSLGFAHPDWINSRYLDKSKTQPNAALEDFLSKEDTNVAITGICDIFSLNAEKGMAIANNTIKPHAFKDHGLPVTLYTDYRKMLESDDIDAVIVTTPDHWHAQITIDAVQAGKHVYCEKCMTRTEEEANKVYEAVKSSGKVFQLGHQNRQQESYIKAKEFVNKNILGKISVVETFTNRNTPHGAWVRHVGKPGNTDMIDWDMFLGSAPKVPFSLDRFYNWSKYWDYSTGLSGQLFSHEYDGINQILDLGIPKSVSSSGGIYYYKDGRETPDVLQSSFEYPNKELVLLYNATLMSSRYRNKLFLGTDASMEVGSELTLKADKDSKQYSKLIEDGVIDPKTTLYSYKPGSSDIDALTTATEQYYASRGLIHTYRDGKRYNIAQLHLMEWLDAIRDGGETSCNIEMGYEEAITCHMATRSYREKRKVMWDAEKRKIV